MAAVLALSFLAAISQEPSYTMALPASVASGIADMPCPAPLRESQNTRAFLRHRSPEPNGAAASCGAETIAVPSRNSTGPFSAIGAPKTKSPQPENASAPLVATLVHVANELVNVKVKLPVCPLGFLATIRPPLSVTYVIM